MKYLLILAVVVLVGCTEGGIGGPPTSPCGDKLKNWDGDDDGCSPVFVCPPKKRCLFDPVSGMYTVVAEEDSTK